MYPLLIIAVILLAIWRGWKLGMVFQLASLLGLAFGCVAARLLAPEVEPWVAEHLEEYIGSEPTPLQDYALSCVSAALVFVAVYLAFKLIASLLKSAMSLLNVGAFNNILGAAFNAAKWIVILSVVLNVWLALFPDSRLGTYTNDGDGNVVELVMAVAPALMDTESPDELDHQKRLEQAREMEQDAAAGEQMQRTR